MTPISSGVPGRRSAAWDDLVQLYSRYVYAIASQGYRLTGPTPRTRSRRSSSGSTTGSRRFATRSLRPWIAQLTRRVCLDRLGRREGAEPRRRAADVDARSTSSTRRSRSARRSGLSDDCQEVLDRFFCRDESYRTIGDELGHPLGDDRKPHLTLPGELRGLYSG